MSENMTYEEAKAHVQEIIFSDISWAPRHGGGWAMKSTGPGAGDQGRNIRTRVAGTFLYFGNYLTTCWLGMI